MIKKILVALDPDDDTEIATGHAIDVARRHEASVTGLALIDVGEIAERVAGTGSAVYYAEQLRDQFTAESREKARELVSSFESSVREAGVEFGEQIEEGVPVERLKEDMKYHDLLVIGKEFHFFYPRPKEETRTLDEVVKEGVAPVLITGDALRSIDRVLVAYDGSPASARTLQRFAQLRPFGTDLRLEIVHVRGPSQKEKKESALLLDLASTYAEAHGFDHVETNSMFGDDPADRLTRYCDAEGVDLVVAGAHAVSRVQRWMFGSTTEALLAEHSVPLFVSH